MKSTITRTSRKHFHFTRELLMQYFEKQVCNLVLTFREYVNLKTSISSPPAMWESQNEAVVLLGAFKVQIYT